MNLEEKIASKMRKEDRILVLEPIDGKPLNSKGLLDRRLFSGENELHAIKHPQNNLWYLQYKSGIVPDIMQQRFTSFKGLYAFTEDYMKKRNVKITKVID